MEEILLQLFSEDFIRFAVALSLLMIGNLFTGVMNSLKAGEFSPKVLAEGALRYALWLIGVTFIVAGAQVYGGGLKVAIGDNEMLLLEALDYAKQAVYLYWAAKGVNNVLSYSKTEKVATAVEPEVQNKFITENIESDEEAVG